MVSISLPSISRRHSLTELGAAILDLLTARPIKPLAKQQRAVAEPETPAKPLAPLATAGERQLAESAVRALYTSLPRALAVAVVDANSSLPIVADGAPSAVGPTSMAVQMARIARRSMEMAAAVTEAAEAPEELIFSSTEQIHVLRPVAGGRWLLYLALDPADTNLAIARALLLQSGTALAAPALPLPV